MTNNHDIKKINSSHQEEKLDSTNANIFLLICLVSISIAVVFEYNVHPREYVANVQQQQPDKENATLRYCVFSTGNSTKGLFHVNQVLERIGYQRTSNVTPWTLMWAHDYPFRALYPNLHRLEPHQKVNHFPGIGFITHKVLLATTKLKHIPKAFKFPKNKSDFLEYAELNKDALFLEKNNDHRGVFLKNVNEIDLSSNQSFVQEYVQRPFLVDGYKFDMGVYVVITSVNPLRAYWYKGDVLFRYCPEKYYPFDPKITDKYVVADSYRPTWEVPSLAYPYVALGHSMKGAFDTYMRSKGKDPDIVWAQVQEAITDLLLEKEHHIIEALKNYPPSKNFFEMMRFDLIMDEDLRVYLLEANMSPNLSSAHFPQNELLYEQVLYNLLSVTGVAPPQHQQGIAANNMISSHKNIAVWSAACASECRSSCDAAWCELCQPCRTVSMTAALLAAHKENLHKGDFRRLFPPTLEPKTTFEEVSVTIKDFSEANKLLYLWYQGKCSDDVTWCR